MSLHYGEPQVAIGVAFAVLALVFATAFTVIARQAGSEVAFERVHGIGYWLRNRWLAVLVVAGVVILGVSFFELPYARGSANGRALVRVKSGQFFWSLTRNRFHVGERVRFDVTSVDVNHGFGLYDPAGHLIGSVQAMPGYHNKLDVTLDHPGVYLIRCLEYCGLSHSLMETTFVVTVR
jgi:cytochrome c oxidase subunit 2